MGSSSAAAASLLKRQLREMQTSKDTPGISCGLVNDNIFEWEVMLMISDDCKYYGGTCFNILPSRVPKLTIPSQEETFEPA